MVGGQLAVGGHHHHGGGVSQAQGTPRGHLLGVSQAPFAGGGGRGLSGGHLREGDTRDRGGERQRGKGER